MRLLREQIKPRDVPEVLTHQTQILTSDRDPTPLSEIIWDCWEDLCLVSITCRSPRGDTAESTADPPHKLTIQCEVRVGEQEWSQFIKQNPRWCLDPTFLWRTMRNPATEFRISSVGGLWDPRQIRNWGETHHTNLTEATRRLLLAHIPHLKGEIRVVIPEERAQGAGTT